MAQVKPWDMGVISRRIGHSDHYYWRMMSIISGMKLAFHISHWPHSSPLFLLPVPCAKVGRGKGKKRDLFGICRM